MGVSEEKVAKIRELWRAGVPNNKIAKTMGVSVKTVRKHIKEAGQTPEPRAQRELKVYKGQNPLDLYRGTGDMVEASVISGSMLGGAIADIKQGFDRGDLSDGERLIKTMRGAATLMGIGFSAYRSFQEIEKAEGVEGVGNPSAGEIESLKKRIAELEAKLERERR